MRDLGHMDVPALSSGVTSPISTNQTEAPAEEVYGPITLVTSTGSQGRAQGGFPDGKATD